MCMLIGTVFTCLFTTIYVFSDKNILVHQTCSCERPLLCSCPFGGRVTYVLGDMGLFWIDSEKHSGNYVDWAKAKQREPAGTARMKAPEV